MRCQVGDCMKRSVQRHHIVLEQELKRRWKSGLVDTERWPSLARLVGDPRNLLDVCMGHHEGHHDGTPEKIALTDLPDESLEFAADLLGPYAYDYLRRRYGGEDPRLEGLLHAHAT